MFEDENMMTVNKIKNNFVYSFLLILLIWFLFFVIFVIATQPSINRVPTACVDSDGDCDVENINLSDNIYESVNLKTSPFGWINATDWDQDVPAGNTIDNATLYVEWYTDTGKGAGNIYVGYYNSTDWVNCTSPLSESGSETNTSCDITTLTVSQLNNIKVRFRGEDLDQRNPAYAYVDYIYIEVNYSAPPLWANQTTNDTNNVILSKKAINLSAQGYDDVGLDYAWLSTNESGEWKNYTDGTYGSPMYLNGVSETWTWSNFTWKNDSFSYGLVGWKIYYNDTWGKENVTDNSTFFVQLGRIPTGCVDSDGDCDVENINLSDNTYEAVNLKTSPFGWINATDWDQDVPAGNVIDDAILHVIWYTDTGKGAGNIYVGYYNSTDWVNCTSPLSESGGEVDTTCDVSSLSLSQLNNIKVRFRGEDLDQRNPAYAYVDYIYIEVNYSMAGMGYLEVNLSLPPDPYNVIQNNTFTINATVYCRSGNCQNVNGTARYNLSSATPDTPMNVTPGEEPFYVNETPALAMKSCPTNPLNVDDFCNLTWTINATGNINTYWEIDVLFNSSDGGITDNHTDDTTISILDCTVDITAQWSSIKFGLLYPSTGPHAAPDNSNDKYNITVNPGSCNLDLYINGTDLTNITYNSQIGVDNVTWSNTSEVAGEFNLSSTVDVIKLDVPQNTNVTTWYWINVPAVYAGYYNGTIYIYGVENGENPP